MEIFILKPLVIGKLSLFSGMWNDAFVHREGLKGWNVYQDVKGPDTKVLDSQTTWWFPSNHSVICNLEREEKKDKNAERRKTSGVWRTSDVVLPSFTFPLCLADNTLARREMGPVIRLSLKILQYKYLVNL